MKIFLRISLIIVGCITALFTYVQVTYKQKFTVQPTGIQASTDSSVIARGKYLVMGATHCYACHINDSLRSLKLKEPMIGGGTYKTMLGTFNIPNITMDAETGIGNFTDEELARAIRYNINHEDGAMVGFMSYNNLSDDDLTAIVSYLRTTASVKNKVPDHDLNILGKTLVRFLTKPKSDVSISELQPDTSAIYGEYLAFTVGQCNSCHTERDKIGRFVGKPFAGGFIWEMPDGTYVSPNLTPDDETGQIYYWNRDVFIQRFRSGRVFEHSPMPWEAYQNMSENDLKALYYFFQSLPPVNNTIAKPFTHKSVKEKE